MRARWVFSLLILIGLGSFVLAGAAADDPVLVGMTSVPPAHYKGGVITPSEPIGFYGEICLSVWEYDGPGIVGWPSDFPSGGCQ